VFFIKLSVKRQRGDGQRGDVAAMEDGKGGKRQQEGGDAEKLRGEDGRVRVDIDAYDKVGGA
jgi:hypothetical protein